MERGTDSVAIVAPIVFYENLEFQSRKGVRKVPDLMSRNISREYHPGDIAMLYPKRYSMPVDDLIQGTAMDGDIPVYLAYKARDEYILHYKRVRSYFYAIADLLRDKIDVIDYRRVIERYIALRPLASSEIYELFPIFVGTDIRESSVSPVKYVLELVFPFPTIRNHSEIYLFRSGFYKLYSGEKVFYGKEYFHGLHVEK